MRASVRQRLDRKILLDATVEQAKSLDIARSKASKTCRLAIDACLRYKREPGITYFVRCGDFVKIGYTLTSTIDRVESFMVGSPYEYDIMAEVSGGVVLEKALHKVFRELRHRNEWFKYEDPLKEFCAICNNVCRLRPKPYDDSFATRHSRLIDELERVNLLTRI